LSSHETASATHSPSATGCSKSAFAEASRLLEAHGLEATAGADAVPLPDQPSAAALAEADAAGWQILSRAALRTVELA